MNSSLRQKVVGHERAWQKLDAALRSGRIPGAWLFFGPEGVGKGAVARALSQALLCEVSHLADGAVACGSCPSCVRVASGQSESLEWLAPDGAQLRIESVRALLGRLSLRRLGRRRIVVIDQAHLLNAQAANALLKTLEEPPEGTHFVLITPEVGGVLPTIRSRCQVLGFAPLMPDEILRAIGANAAHGLTSEVVDLARGSVGRTLELISQGEASVRLTAAVDEWTAALGQGEQVWERVGALKDLASEDVQQGQRLAHLVLVRFRNALASRALNQGINSPFSELIGALSWPEVSRLSDQLVQLESDLQRGFDRQLVIEDLTLSLHRAAQREAQS